MIDFFTLSGNEKNIYLLYILALVFLGVGVPKSRSGKP